MYTGVHRFLAFDLLVNHPSSGTLAFSLRLAPFLLTASSDTPASSLRLMPPPLAIGTLSLRPGSSAPSPTTLRRVGPSPLTAHHAQTSTMYIYCDNLINDSLNK